MSNPRTDEVLTDSRLVFWNGEAKIINHPSTKLNYAMGSTIVTRVPPLPSSGSKDETTECIIDGTHKQLILDQLQFSGQIQTGERRPYEIIEVNGMGLGMIATRNINEGEEIVKEQPLLLVPQSLAQSPVIIEGYLKLAAVRMSRADQAKLMPGLETAKNLGELKGGELMNTVMLNTMKVTELERIGIMGKGYVCVPRDLARVNHSCVPNARLIGFDPATFSYSVVALTKIAKGEQISRNYLPYGYHHILNFEERSFNLKLLSLICHCSLCHLSGSELDACNAFRAGLDNRVFGLISKLESLVQNPDEYLTCIDLPRSHVKDVLGEAGDLEFEMDYWGIRHDHWARVRSAMDVLLSYSLDLPLL